MKKNLHRNIKRVTFYTENINIPKKQYKQNNE